MDRVPPFDYPTAERISSEETGGELAEVFENLSAEPIATASIGQVYAGDLDGERVAIKLQRPKAESMGLSDIRGASLNVSTRSLMWGTR